MSLSSIFGKITAIGKLCSENNSAVLIRGIVSVIANLLTNCCVERDLLSEKTRKMIAKQIAGVNRSLAA